MESAGAGISPPGFDLSRHADVWCDLEKKWSSNAGPELKDFLQARQLMVEGPRCSETNQVLWLV